MKAKYTIIALLALTFFGCDDNTAGLGLGMFPGSDQNINGQLQTFKVTTKSAPAGQIYAKTNIGYVGKYTDKLFGSYEAGFLSTLNCPEKLTFPGVYDKNNFNVYNTMVGEGATEEAAKDIIFIRENPEDENSKIIGNIRAVELYLWYSSYFGDSLTACRLSVYELDEKLESAKNEAYYYTNINPDDFYDSTKEPLGTKAYTAVDLSVKDSIRNLSNYVPRVHLTFGEKVAKDVGGRILKAARSAGSDFDRDKFIDEFNGLYVKSDYGDGTILYIDQVQMNVVYKCYAIDSIKGTILPTIDGKDSTFYDLRQFVSTREVIQANHLHNNQDALNSLIAEDKCTYLKTPAGIFTEATLPIQKISEDLAGDTLNAVNLAFFSYNQSKDEKFGMSAPSNVMLIRSKDKEWFFANNKLNDGVSSFLTSHSNNQYTFSNITKLINACVNEKKEAERIIIKEKKSIDIENVYNEKTGTFDKITVTTMEEWEKITQWDKVTLIPVVVTYDSANSNYSTPNIIGIKHDLKPAYVKLKGGSIGDTDHTYQLDLNVIFTNFGEK